MATWPFPASLVQPSAPESRRPGAALVAGLAAGLVGGAVKAGWEGFFPPLPDGRDAPPKVLADQVGVDPEKYTYSFFGRDVTWAIPVVHYGFSAATVGLYAVLAETFPRLRAGWGVPYGVAVWVGAHEIALPALKLTPPAKDLPAQEQVSELLGHAVWMLAAEFVRRDLRQRIAGVPDADVRTVALKRLARTARAGLRQTARTVAS